MSRYRFTKHVFRLISAAGWDPCDVEPAEIVHRFRSGDCFDFAIALHKETGWPIVAAFGREAAPFHALNVHPSGRLVNAHGFIALKQLARFYGRRKVRVEPLTPKQAYEISMCGYDGVRDAAKWLRTMRHPPFDEVFPPAETFG
jgi:hypothetical protein